jgi:hypothetical protein
LRWILTGLGKLDRITFSAKQRLGYYELQKQESWFDKGCSKLLDQRKQAKLQWLQDSSKVNRDNMNNIKKEGIFENKINEVATNGKNKIMRDLYIEIKWKLSCATNLKVTY